MAELIVTLEPLAVSVPVLVALCPTTTLPKSTLPGLTDSCPGELADPDKAMAGLGFVAFEVRVRFPVVVPLVCGVNATLKVRLCPGVSVCGTLNPLTLNAADDTTACEMLTLALPLLVTVWYCEEVAPSATVPNARLEGLTLSWPAAAVVPVPESPTLVLKVPREPFWFVGGFNVKSKLPLTVPTVKGAKVPL